MSMLSPYHVHNVSAASLSDSTSSIILTCRRSSLSMNWSVLSTAKSSIDSLPASWSGLRESASARVLSLPGRYLMSNRYRCSSKPHLAILGECFFRFVNCVRFDESLMMRAVIDELVVGCYKRW